MRCYGYSSGCDCYDCMLLDEIELERELALAEDLWLAESEELWWEEFEDADDLGGTY